MRDALFQTATISGRTLACTDTAQLNALRVEAVAWSALETAVRGVKAVYATAASGGSFHLRIAMTQHVPGEARNAIAAVMGCLANVKHVFVVDPDIDIYSDQQVEWAMATRFQADRDLVVQALATLIDAAGIRLGLGPEGNDVVDLVQARVAIEMVRGVLVIAEQELGVASVRPFREPLAQLQLAYAKIAEQPDSTAPKESGDAGSRRLWVPGE